MGWLQQRKNENLIKNSLKDSVAVTKLQQNTFNVNNYQKIDFKDFGSNAMSAVPNIMAAVTNISLNNGVNAALDSGAYRIVFKDGAAETVNNLCRNSEGNLITSYRDVNGHFNQAGLVPIDKTEVASLLKAQQATLIFATAMHVAAMVVGEYYKSEINTKLLSMQNSLHRIENFLYDVQLTEILSAFDYLAKVQRDFSGMLLNNEQTIATLYNVNQIKLKSLQNIRLFKKQLKDLLDQFDVSQKDAEQFALKVNNFNLFLALYKASIRLYSFATVIEVNLSGNYSEMYLKNCTNDINDIVKEYSNEWDDINKQAYSFFKNTKALKPNVWEKIAMFFTGKSKDDISNYQEEICNNYEKQFNTHEIEAEAKPFVSYIDNLNSIHNKELDLYYYNGDVYIDKKYLEAEEN